MSTQSHSRIEPLPFPGSKCAAFVAGVVTSALSMLAAALVTRSLKASERWAANLSDHMLRDIGLDRRDVRSVLAQMEDVRTQARSHLPL